MLRRVALVRTDVSEELSASIIRVTRICELGLVTANVIPSSPILVTLMIEALSSSETSVLTRATRPNIPEDAILQFQQTLFRRALSTFIWKQVDVYKQLGSEIILNTVMAGAETLCDRQDVRLAVCDHSHATSEIKHLNIWALRSGAVALQVHPPPPLCVWYSEPRLLLMNVHRLEEYCLLGCYAVWLV
jgi:hypothetical protein